MSALICGSIAYDTVMVFPDQFKKHILPEQIHILNVSFMVTEMRRQFGGCAGNIAYNLHLLGGQGKIMATIGAQDGAEYLARLDQLGIDRRHVREIPDAYTAQAFVTTDMSDNQITAFHPGAMLHSHENHVDDAEGITLGIVAPDGLDGMLHHCERFAARGIPFIFDPGQGLPLFDGATLRKCLEQADYCIVNDYEAKLIGERTGLTEAQIAAQLQGYIITLGAQGVRIYDEGRLSEIAAAPISDALDPTGCGDAFRGGFIYGLQRGWFVDQAARLGALMGAIKIETRGPQNHTPTREEIARRLLDAYGQPLD